MRSFRLAWPSANRGLLAMHLETLLYMLLQSDKILAPPGIQPDFEALAHRARLAAVPNEWIKVPEREIAFGLDTSAGQEVYSGCFGWDNEKPVRTLKTPAFEAQARGLTNGDYAHYLIESGALSYPASWTIVPNASEPKDHGNSHTLMNGYTTPSGNGFFRDKAVRTVYGPVPLLFALEWPIMASYDELSACAEWFGGRIPTMEEARSIYSYADELKEELSFALLGETAMVNGYANHLNSSSLYECFARFPRQRLTRTADVHPKSELRIIFRLLPRPTKAAFLRNHLQAEHNCTITWLDVM